MTAPSLASPRDWSRPLSALAVLLGVLAAFQLMALFHSAALTSSPDLKALWMAGLAWETGAQTEIYPPAGLPFEMVPPAEWQSYEVDRRDDEVLFPYLYPPLWAALAGRLTTVMTFESFATGVRVLNLALLPLMGWLAWRCIEPLRSWRSGSDDVWKATCFVAASTLVLATTLGARVAVETGQLQILVSALLLWTAERDRAGARRAAGAILALAAAIKAFPAVFIVIWLVRRDWRALCVFALVGGALGMASVAVAGWPLHLTFLNILDDVSASAIVIPLMHGVDPVLAYLGAGGPLVPVHPSDPQGVAAVAHWSAVTKSQLWIWSGRFALLGGLFTAAVWGASDRPLMVWPLSFAIAAFLGPMPWAYQFVPALAFLPLIALGMSLARGLCIVLTVVILTLPAVSIHMVATYPHQPIAMVSACFAMGIMLVSYVVLAKRFP